MIRDLVIQQGTEQTQGIPIILASRRGCQSAGGVEDHAIVELHQETRPFSFAPNSTPTTPPATSDSLPTYVPIIKRYFYRCNMQ
jgi:hypothetical protein